MMVKFEDLLFLIIKIIKKKRFDAVVSVESGTNLKF